MIAIIVGLVAMAVIVVIASRALFGTATQDMGWAIGFTLFVEIACFAQHSTGWQAVIWGMWMLATLVAIVANQHAGSPTTHPTPSHTAPRRVRNLPAGCTIIAYATARFPVIRLPKPWVSYAYITVGTKTWLIRSDLLHQDPVPIGTMINDINITAPWIRNLTGNTSVQLDFTRFEKKISVHWKDMPTPFYEDIAADLMSKISKA